MSKTYKEFIKEYDMGMTVPTMAYLKPTPSMKLRRKENKLHFGYNKVREKWIQELMILKKFTVSLFMRKRRNNQVDVHNAVFHFVKFIVIYITIFLIG